jgi:hypothetical protein
MLEEPYEFDFDGEDEDEEEEENLRQMQNEDLEEVRRKQYKIIK